MLETAKMATWAISKEETNYARLSIALIKVCADLLRETLLQHIPNRNIQTAVVTNKKKIKPLLNGDQKQLLFPKPPATFTGSVADFDISLLYLLIRNASTVPSHGKGWGKPPIDQPRDCSIGANVERIRLLRNKISGHSVDGKVSDAGFESFWTDLEDCIQDLEGNLNLRSYTKASTKLKIQDLDPEYATRCIDKFEAQLSDIQAQQVDQMKYMTDIKQDTDKLQNQLTHITGTKEKIVRLSDIQIEQRAIQEFQKQQLVGLKKDIREMRNRTIPFPFCMRCFTGDFNLQRVRSRLIDVFTNSYQFIPKNPFDPDSGTNIAFVYTELEIEDFSEEKTMEENVQRIKQFENLIRLPSLKYKTTRIYLEGKAGSGKTVFACKLITDWCNSHLKKKRLCSKYLVEFDICMPVPLHNICNSNTLAELVHNVLGDSSGINVTELADYIVNNQERTLVVMDGLDEYADNCPVVDEIIRRKALPKCTVVVTSRPWKIQDLLHKGRYVDTKARILGFSDDNTVNYAKRVFQYILAKSPEMSVSLANELRNEIQNRGLTELSKLPLILLFMCYLWTYEETLSDTETDIYIKVIKCMVGNYTAKRNILPKSRRNTNLQTVVLDKSRELFLTLGEIAYRGLTCKNTKGELMFDEDYLNEQFDTNHIQEALKIGLLSEQKTFSVISTTSHLSFPHKSVQEFFAAYLLVYSENIILETEIAILIDSIEVAENFENVLKFIVGIGQNQDTSEIVLKPLAARCLISQIKEKKCLEKYLNLFCKLTRELKTRVGSVQSPAIFDVISEYFFDGVVVRMTPSGWRDLFKLLPNGSDIGMMIQKSCLQIQVHSMSALKTLTFKDVKMDADYWFAYFEYLGKAPNLQSITISDCSGLSNSQIKIPTLPALKALVVHNVSMTSRDLSVLFQSLSNSPNLETFHFAGSGDKNTVTVGSRIEVPQLPTLTLLELQYVEMDPKDCKCFFASLCNIPDLENLVLVGSSQCFIDMGGCQIKISALRALKMLKCVEIIMNPTDWRVFLESLSSTPKLETIIIESCSGMCGSAVALPLLPNLKKLEIQHVIMKQQDCKCFFRSLFNTPNLESLALIGSGVGSINMSGCQIQVPPLPALNTLRCVKVTMHPVDWRVLFASLDNSPFLETIIIAYCSEMAGSEIAIPQLLVLKTLEVRDVAMRQSDCKLLFVSLSNSPNLDKLVLMRSYQSYVDTSCCRIEIPRLSVLKTLKLVNVTMIPADWKVLFASLLHRTPNLETFTIEDCSDMSDSQVALPQLSALKTLQIQYVVMKQLDCKCFFPSLFNTQNLKILVLEGLYRDSILMTGSHIQLPRLPVLNALKFVRVTMNPEDWRVFFASLLSNTSNLETVIIQSCSGMSGGCIELPSLNMLHTVTFFSVEMFPNDWRTLVYSLEKSKQIQIVKIKFCNGWINSKTEVPCLPNLTEMDLTGTELSKLDVQILMNSILKAPKLHQIKGLYD